MLSIDNINVISGPKFLARRAYPRYRKSSLLRKYCAAQQLSAD